MFTPVEARTLSNAPSIAAFVQRLEERTCHGNPCEILPETHPVPQDHSRWCCIPDTASDPFVWSLPWFHLGW
jgi:hypothetical protein